MPKIKIWKYYIGHMTKKRFSSPWNPKSWIILCSLLTKFYLINLQQWLRESWGNSGEAHSSIWLSLRIHTFQQCLRAAFLYAESLLKAWLCLSIYESCEDSKNQILGRSYFLNNSYELVRSEDQFSVENLHKTLRLKKKIYNATMLLFPQYTSLHQWEKVADHHFEREDKR